MIGSLVALSLAALAPLGAALTACASHPSTPAADPGRTAKVVSVTIVANECATLNRAYAKATEDAMSKLTDGCTQVPGGSQRFTANLLPGGRIELTVADGGPEVVPLCVLKNDLRHKAPLTKPCRLDVRLDETTTTIAPADGGGDGS